MNLFKSFLILIGLLGITTTLVAQTTIKSQSFEPGLGDWSFDTIPTTYNTHGDSIVTGDEDVWAAVISLNNIDTAHEGIWFWGMQDLNNANGGGSFTHSLAFSSVSTSGYSDVMISFNYNVFEFDAGDDLTYEVFFNGISQGDSLFFDGSGNSSSNDWDTIHIFVPDSVYAVSLSLKAKQNGGGDMAGYDNVIISGTPNSNCSITNIERSNIGTCNNNNTPGNPNDDFYTCDLEVSYLNNPSTGSLLISSSDIVSGDTTASGPFTGTTTFSNIGLKANGTNANILAVFSDSTQCQLDLELLNSDVENCSPNSEVNESNLKLDGSNLFVNGVDKGVILVSPNGTCFKLMVGDDGMLTTTEVPCPID